MLLLRPYTPSDYPTINAWWQSRHGALSDFPSPLLPPLGVVVEEEGEPVFALWCYESFGVGVAFLEYPVSRPGRTAAQTKEAFAEALRGITALAGKRCEPPGEYRVFRAVPGVSLCRGMRALGFVKEYPEDQEHIPVMLNLTEQ
jgi:hypothetical protein